MKRKVLFLTIQIFCVIHLSSSSSRTRRKASEPTIKEEELDNSLVEDGRLQENWNTNYSEFTEDINLSNLGIRMLSENAFAKFFALNRLDLSSNKLESRHNLADALYNLSPSILNLSHNNFGFENYAQEEMSNFRKYDKLFPFESNYFWSVDLSYNSIREIGINFDVVHLNLSNNLLQCHHVSESYLRLHSPSHITAMYMSNLDLSHNLINCQDPIFASNTHTLDMSYNKLKGLNKNGLFMGLRLLSELNLSHNEIRYIHPQAFEDNIRLQHLDLKSNLIRNIYERIWVPLSFIRYIDLSSNRLESINWKVGAPFRRSTNRITVNVANNSDIVWWSQEGNYDFRFCNGWYYSVGIDHEILGCL